MFGRPFRYVLLLIPVAVGMGLVPTDRSARADDETYWAFQRPVAPPVPAVQDQAWVKTPLDAFILARLEKSSLAPASEADRITLIRRLTFGLTGLSPKPEEVDAFLNDASAGAYEKLVERLLASPHYGEHWARHWLDVVRYADSDGFEYDDPRPNAWRYRDWVIRSLNEDLPYSEFVKLQIAGDELAPQDHGALAATGFNRLGPLRLNAGNQDLEKNRQEVLVEMTDAVGSIFLGLTMGCARCHDHKFDPIPQADYYRLQAFFAATEASDLSLASAAEKEAYERNLEQWKDKIGRLQAELSEIDKSCSDRLVSAKKAALPAELQEALSVAESEQSPRQRELVASVSKSLEVSKAEIEASLTDDELQTKARLQAEMQSMRQKKPDPLSAVWAVADTGAEAPVTFLLKRGQPGRHGDVVEPRFPSAAAEDPGLGIPANGTAAAVGPEGEASTGRRTALAQWLASEENPLAARVMVNRIWQNHFGRGLVTTPNDFGLMSNPPTHPELLDWLAVEFMAQGWSLKAMHRLMVTSATYRQSSLAQGVGLKIDPDNNLLGRMRRHRLSAEALRDSVLAIAGTLIRKAGGPGVFLPLSKEVAGLVYKGSWTPTSEQAEHTRRTIYLFVKRNLPDPFLEAFDAPGTMVSCAVRSVSIHAGQALALLNSEFLNEQSRALSLRLLHEVEFSEKKNIESAEVAKLVDRAYRLVVGRPPRVDELELAQNFLAQQTQFLKHQDTENETPDRRPDFPVGTDPYFAEALADYCLVMLNLDEFLFLD